MVGDSRQQARALLARAVEFHGHLGPFLVLGIRMGAIAQSIFKGRNRNDLTAIMFVDPNPPASCAVDGVQVSSGCTLGKGTIRVSQPSDRVAGEFCAGDRVCTIGVKTEVLNELLDSLKKASEQGVLELAEQVLARPDEELFEIKLAA